MLLSVGTPKSVGSFKSVYASPCVLAAALIAGVMGCSADSPSPTTPSAVEGGRPQIVPPTGQLPLVGGLSLDGYCQSLGYANSTLTKPQIGPNAAFNNWRCRDAHGGLHLFSMERACQWQWGTNAIQAHPTDRGDAFTWVCYRTPGG